MGCWMSKSKCKTVKNNTFDGIYVAITPPTRGLSKRLWRSRNSCASSSGVSSGCNTPLRSSKAYNSRCDSSETATDENSTPIKKILQRTSSEHDLIYENLPAFLRNIPLDINQDEEQQDQVVIDESGGYYTDESSDCSTPLATGLVYTQNESELEQANSSSSECEAELNMEMLIMGKAYGIMPKTSSPVFQRRDLTFDIPTTTTADVPLPAPTASYQKWRKYLQMTPTYALNNITNIPEAIAGRFCPAEFPGYSEVRNLPNKFTIQQHHNNHYQEAAETIIMELPVPTISTEL